ncbi:hypothetical protein WICMUC_003834 [Wickerhamomyces mucosus]|uniref:Protein SIP5 n=1 Tax=Wickerhamomyces mucosus TaxID=1378264 RepID=A0A9P8TBP6_9ASCO|nr:hypothetical protein WICMUC_003834 [Wickerhamomyces mucosus]
MGNVPGKEERPSGGIATSRRRGSSVSSTFSHLHSNKNARANSSKGNTLSLYTKKQSTKDLEIFKEAHSLGLVVKYDENVDGGYLAPYGIYNSNLDYNISIVKDCIIERRMAPFYLPLQDYSPDWSDQKLVELIDSLRLHALPHEAGDEDEDLNYDIDGVDESLLSRKELKKHLSKKFNKELKLKRIKYQENEQSRYLKERSTSEQASSDDLKLFLYRTVVECPICFLYYPKWINVTRCCNQAICSECFVQIKRLDPHFPHDSDDDTHDEHKKDVNLLQSEQASCPYCATSNFGITYLQPTEFRTGLGGISPSSFTNGAIHHSAINRHHNSISENEELTVNVSSSIEIQENYIEQSQRKNSTIARRRGSLPANHPYVITTDYIRPDWEQKLLSARAKLAKKAAAASAIHASNLLVNETEQQIEERMIEEAMRLSLIDEETRKRRESSSRRL